MIIVIEVRGKGTHVKQAPQRKQNLLRLRRCFWVSKMTDESEFFYLKYYFQMAFTVDLKDKIVNVIGP